MARESRPLIRSSTGIGGRGNTGDSHRYHTALNTGRCAEGKQLCRMECRHDVYIYGVVIHLRGVSGCGAENQGC